MTLCFVLFFKNNNKQELGLRVSNMTLVQKNRDPAHRFRKVSQAPRTRSFGLTPARRPRPLEGYSVVKVFPSPLSIWMCLTCFTQPWPETDGLEVATGAPCRQAH